MPNAASLSFLYAEIALEVENGTVFDQAQNKLVMDQRTKDALVRFQEDKGLASTRKLDYQILKIVSGRTSGELQYCTYSPSGTGF